ncbi:thiamine diphosphokinase [Peptostreptococcus equinus]|uniref:Thiamine diphosphokinase n=1 Tax=Peptostreptococcus equinus TaxID=3003601 RepID=A0ABY7JMA1_9FIRM|nr:thiamine diphosphokinase [Peptostreptococcus sp. CBA3647]WAW14225.1 thiamine diphosphokinase [Peptostreptococcus sp. CBA3647]
MDRFYTAKKACLVLNGVITDYNKVSTILNDMKYDIIIGVDGGCNHLDKLNIVPNHMVGDMDSIDKEVLDKFINLGVNKKKYPEKKNETDTELAVLLACEEGAVLIDIYGALGGRIDHEIANVLLLKYIAKQNAYSRILSENEEIYLLENDELTIRGKKGNIVSTIPVGGNANGVTLCGLEYPLNEFDMEYSRPRGISNTMLEDVCHINVRDGSLLIVKYDKDA